MASNPPAAPLSVRYPLLLLVFPAWLALLFYLPTLTHGFVWDDTYFLRDLPYLRDPALWWQALQEPLFVSRNYFRPLPLLTFMVEARLGGSQAWVFHAVNVVLHMLNTTLVIILARSVLSSDRRGVWVASGVGVLFALHPALVENVSWISDRFDLLMASFILVALCAECGVRNTWRRDLLQALSLLGALLSKETGIVMLPLLLLWQVFLQMDSGTGWAGMGRGALARWRLWGGLLIAVAIYLALRHAAFGFLYRGNSSLQAGDLIQHLLLVGKTLGSYVVLLLFPFGQIAPVHPAATPIAADDAAAWLGMLVIVTIASGLVYAVWHRKPPAVLGLMALTALGPVSNLLPLTTGDNIVHDRYLLLTVAFVALALGRLLLAAPRRWLVPALATWGLAAALAVVLAVPHWESDNTLWEWAYSKHPDSQIAAENYMTVLVNTQRNDEALLLTEKFLREGNWMQRSTAHYLRAFIFRRQHQLGDAEREIKQALDLPRRDDALGAYLASEKLNALARIQMDQERYVPAGKNLQESLRLTPHMASSYYLLALLHYRQGQLVEGDAALAEACRYAVPSYAEVFRREIAPERERASRTS